MVIKSAKYKTSVVKSEEIIQDGFFEFAFVGRSNVGKSTLINNLTGQKGLAKASSSPGKTRMINYFDINDNFRFVDLPGYGYAKVGKKDLQVWSSLMEEYLLNSKFLLSVFVLLDIRHLPTDQDKQMIKFLIYNQIPFVIVATKIDKIAKSKVKQCIKEMAKSLNLREEIFLKSGLNGEGKEEILNLIENKLEIAGDEFGRKDN